MEDLIKKRDQVTKMLLEEIKKSEDMKYIASCAHVLIVNQNYYNRILRTMSAVN